MNVAHIDRLRTPSTFKAGLYMGGKKTIETQVQDILTICTLLTAPVQRDDRLARSSLHREPRFVDWRPFSARPGSVRS